MERIRPVTYGESIEAKEFIQDLKENCQNKTSQEVNETIDQVVKNPSLLTIKTKDLPSQGKVYSSKEISYSPLSFGEVKFISSSDLSEKDLIHFFLKKIHFDEKDKLTYYDFLYLAVLIKISTFGTEEYGYTWKCSKCGNKNKEIFSLNDLEFYDLKVTPPAEIHAHGKTYKFYPMTVQDKLFLLENELENDEDWRLATMLDEDREKAYSIIVNELSGIYTNLLESVDNMLFHGVKPLKFKCFHKQETKEVCGNLIAVPFQDIPKNVCTTEKLKKYLRERILFKS